MSDEVARLADVAMYEAEPIKNAENGPKVYLLNQTEQPLRGMAAAAEMYRGVVVRDIRHINRTKALEWLDDMMRTSTKAPMEFVHFHFLLEGVTRAFTHQHVRQRTATYVQESMRFAVKRDAAIETGMPPTLAARADDDPARIIWEDAVDEVSNAYNRMIDAGVPAEDARGILPTNILTRIHYETNLRSLIDHAGMRLCSQAQFEWKQVWAQILRAIRSYGPETERWQQEAIANLFKPVCYHEGRCKFRASTDRACSIRDRVEAHYAKGEKPEVWLDINPIEPLLEGAARVAPGTPRA